jgi:ABC-type uncharacterized transport system permease subunit
MYSYRGLNKLEKACVAATFIGAFLAGLGAFTLVQFIDHRLRMETVLPAFAALIAFFVTLP